MKKIIVAIDSFKGCLTSAEANQAASEGVFSRMPEAQVVQVPVSDGGEGFLEAFHAAMGGEIMEVNVKDPLMRPIVAQYLKKGDTAVIEIAKASGLTLLKPEERNPMVATSYGTGQLVVDAVRRGCKHIIVGLGGSATSDCGIGMLEAIDDERCTIDSDVRFTIATDVTNPLCGENGAAYVFGPQKGASHDDVLALDARAKRFAEDSAKQLGRDCQNMPGAGAAGGLGYAFLQYMNAECRSGIDLLLDAIRFNDLLQDADLVITGEGSADRQTLMGKLPYGILQRAQKQGVPVMLIAGRIADEQQLLNAGFSRVACINPPGLPLEIAMQPEMAKENIRKTIKGQLAMPVVRPATQANRFYTGDARELSEEVDSLLARHSGDKKYSNVAALIVPHAGYYFSGNVAASAYMAIDPKKQYKRIFLLGPSHHEWLDGASVNTEADWYETPLGKVKVDHETAVVLTNTNGTDKTDLKETTNYTDCTNCTNFSYRPEAHDREHCLEVQLPFLQRRFKETLPPIVPIIISTNDYDKLKQIAEVLKPYFTDDNLFVISSDFSHYPKYEDACEVDIRTGKAIETGDVEEFIATINANARSGKRNLHTSACGEFAIITLMLMLDNQYEVKHLMYQNSGDIDNYDHSRVVGYHSFAILRKDSYSSGQTRTGTDFSLSADNKKMLKGIALQSIVDSLNGKSVSVCVSPLQKYPMLNKKCGAFISLHKRGHLRGCIGHFGEDYPLHEIVAEMARAAAFEDPRFMPVTRDELDDLDIEISVLTPMRRIQSLDEFELHRHGIYIKKGYRSGTFLPQVADEVNWTKEEFVGHCSQDKAGLGWDGWKDAELYVYEAIVF